MAVTLRFQGRFVHVIDKNNKTLFVVAPRFAPVPFGEHRPLMSIRHSGVLFKTGRPGNKRQVTTFDPAFRILSDVVAEDPQVMVWDLSGLKVTYLTSSRATGELVSTMVGGERVEVVGMDALEDNERRASKRKDELKPGTDWANTVIQVTDKAEATAVAPVGFQYSHESRIKAHQPPDGVMDRQNPRDKLIKNPAEIVNVSVTPPNPAPDDDKHLILRFEKGGKVVGDVCVREGAIACFSNACAPIHEPTGIDEEFSRFYDMLDLHHVDALIPFSDEGGLIEGIPCYQQSSMSF